MIVRSPARQGMRGSLATDGVVRRRRSTWPGRQWSRWKSAVSMWLKGHGGSTFTLCLASPAAGCPGRTTMTRYWSPLSAAHRHGWWACCVGGAGRDLRHVGVRGGESVWGRAAGRALMLRSTMSRWRAGGGARHTIGAVWFGANRVCRRAFRHAQVCCGWAGGRRRCHTVVTSGAKHGGTQGDTLRRFLQVGGRGGTSWDG